MGEMVAASRRKMTIGRCRSGNVSRKVAIGGSDVEVENLRKKMGELVVAARRKMTLGGCGGGVENGRGYNKMRMVGMVPSVAA